MSELGFSGQVDHLNLATADLVLHSSSVEPAAKGVEQAEDEKGNTIAQGVYADGVGKAVECVYHLINGTLNLNTLKLGPEALDKSTIVGEISVDTNNGEWPTITATGYIDATGDPATDTVGSTFTLPSIVINGQKQAQAMSFTKTGTDSRILSSSITATGEIHFVLADADTVGAVGFTGAEITGEATLLIKDGADTIAWTAPLIVTQPLTSAGEITGWAEGSTSAQGILTADV